MRRHRKGKKSRIIKPVRLLYVLGKVIMLGDSKRWRLAQIKEGERERQSTTRSGTWPEQKTRARSLPSPRLFSIPRFFCFAAAFLTVRKTIRLRRRLRERNKITTQEDGLLRARERLREKALLPIKACPLPGGYLFHAKSSSPGSRASCIMNPATAAARKAR